MVVNTFNLSSQEVEVGKSLSLRSAWPTDPVTGQPELIQRSLVFENQK